MAYQRSILQYWNGSAWTTAYVTGTSNALISFSIRETMGSPRNGVATLSNRSSDPYHASASSRKGPFTGVFTDFMQIRIRDEESYSILFSGRVYGVKEVYDAQYGNVMELTCRDAMSELRDNMTDGNAGFTINTSASVGTNIGPGAALDSEGKYYATAHADRSGIIKSLIRLYSRDGNITVLNGGTKFVESNQKFRQDGKYELGTQSQKSPLGHIANLSAAEPLDSSGTSFSYDYYVDSNITSTATNHNPAANFNYFPRGTRPNAAPQTYGLRVEYPQSGGFTTDGRTEVMLQDFDFERPKEDLYSNALVHYSDAGDFETGNENELFEKTINMELWKIKSINGGSSFSCYPNSMQQSLLTGDTLELTNGTDVGKLHYLSATSGGSDSSPEYAIVSGVTSDMVEMPGTTFRSTANSGRNFQLVSRQSAAYGINRTFRINASNETRPSQIIESVVSRLMRTASQVVRGKVRMLRKPHFYIDNTNVSITSGVITWTNIVNYGVKSGMTVVKLDANNEPTTTYGYISSCTNNDITVSNWSAGSVSNGDKVRLYIPVRAGDMVYVRNDLVGVTGMRSIVTGISYSEQPGVSSTELDVVGSEARDEGGWARPSIQASIANAVSQKIELPKQVEPSQQPKGNQTFSTDLNIIATGATTGNAHRHVKWGSKGANSNATITTADGIAAAIVAGGDHDANNSGSYAIYGAGTISELAENTTYYAFIDYSLQKGTSNKTLYFTTTGAIMADKNRVPLAEIRVTEIGDGFAPSIMPLGSGSMSVNGFDITAGSIKTGYLQSNVVDTDQLVADAIDVKHTITGSTIQTTATDYSGIKLNTSGNQRLDLWSGTGNIGAATERMKVYDYNNNPRMRLRTYNNRDFGLNILQETSGFMLSVSGSVSGTSTPYGLFSQSGAHANTSTHGHHLGYIRGYMGSGGNEEVDETFWGTGNAPTQINNEHGVYGWAGLLLSKDNRHLHLLPGGSENYKIKFPNSQPAVNKFLKVNTVTEIDGTAGAGLATLTWADGGGGASVTVGSTTTGNAGTNAIVTDGDSGDDVQLNFVIPRGDTGQQGIQGIQGIQGPAGDDGEVTGNGTGNRMAWWTSSTNITEGDYYASTGSIGSENGTYPDITAGVLKAESSVKLKSVTTGTGDYDLQINTNGYLRKTSSSQRYKENIAALSIDSAKIYNLTAKSFKWIDTTDQDSNEDVTSTVTVTGKNDFGLIAEEVHLELPELITYDDQNRPDAVNYKMLSVLLIEELKKLEARVKTLEGG